MSEPTPPGGALPPNPSLEFLRKTAKARLETLRADQPDAQLADAQRLVAREHGFASWRALRAAVEAAAPAETTERRHRRFRNAVNRGDLAATETLLKADPSLANAPLFGFDQRALGHANGNLAMVDLLLKHGADLNAKSDWWAGGFGLLDMAKPEYAEELIRRGAIVDVFAAANLNKLDRLRELLDAEPALVHAKGGDGGRPLHFAKSIEVIDLLLSRGADIDARDVDHESTAAQWMLPRPADETPHDMERDLALVRHLVERGAATDVFMLAALGDAGRLGALLAREPGVPDVRVGTKTYAPCPDAPGRHIYLYKFNEGRSPFEVARAFGREACVRLLWAHSTPRQRLLAACATGDANAAREVVAKHPDVWQTLDPDDAKALPNAAWSGNEAAVRLMLDMGFDPAAAPGTTASALHCAAWHGRAAIVRLILNHAATQGRHAAMLASIETTYGSTPLGWCCHGSTNCRNPTGDYPAVARMLLDAGAVVGPNLADASPQVRAVLSA